MQAPLLPFISKELGGDSSSFSSMQSYFSIVQLLGGIASGPFGDTFGSKLILTISNLSSSLSYFLTASASTMSTLNLSRLPTLFQHGMLGTRGMVALLVPSGKRAVFLGYIMLAYGCGMAVGPALGGVLASSWDVRASAWIASLGALVGAVVVGLCLPSLSGGENKKGSYRPDAERHGFSTRIYRVLSFPRVRRLLLIKLFMDTSSRILYSTLPFILVQDPAFSADSQDLGYLLSYSGIVVSLSQALLIGPITNRLEDREIILSCLAFISLSFLGLSQAYSMAHIWIVFIPLLVFGTLFSTINTAQLSKSVSLKDVGTVLSLDMSIGSFVGIFSSQLGIYIFEGYGFEYFGIACSICTTMATLLCILTYRQYPQTTSKTN